MINKKLSKIFWKTMRMNKLGLNAHRKYSNIWKISKYKESLLTKMIKLISRKVRVTYYQQVSLT